MMKFHNPSSSVQRGSTKDKLFFFSINFTRSLLFKAFLMNSKLVAMYVCTCVGSTALGSTARHGKQSENLFYTQLYQILLCLLSSLCLHFCVRCRFPASMNKRAEHTYMHTPIQMHLTDRAAQLHRYMSSLSSSSSYCTPLALSGLYSPVCFVLRLYQLRLLLRFALRFWIL